MNNHKLISHFDVGLVTDSELENMINRVEEHIRECKLKIITANSANQKICIEAELDDYLTHYSIMAELQQRRRKYPVKERISLDIGTAPLLTKKELTARTVENIIKHSVSSIVSVPSIDICLTDDLVEDLGCDSLDEVELIMDLEEIFSVEIPDVVARKVRTVGDAVNIAKKYLVEQKGDKANEQSNCVGKINQ